MDQETRTRLTKYINQSKPTIPLDPETEALRDWLAVLTFLWESIGKSYDGTAREEKQFDAYVKIFGDVPLEILEKGVTRAIANNGKYQTIPTPGAIWEAIRKELELSPRDDVFEVMQNWSTVRWDKCIIRMEAQ